MTKREKLYKVKARIREWNYSTNQKLLRKGSLHFLPLEEISFFDEARIKEFALCDQRISVRGMHRSGVYKTKRVHIRFLENLRLELIKQPFGETMEHIRRNKILVLEKGSKKHDDIEEIIAYINANAPGEIEEREIKDELYYKAADLVQDMQKTLKQNNTDYFVDQFIQFPVVHKYFGTVRQNMQYINRDYFLTHFEEIISPKTRQSILETSLETLYPSERRMIVGSVELSISKEEIFKIDRIHTLY